MPRPLPKPPRPLALALLLLSLSAEAHPVVRGNFEVHVEPDCVRFTATVSMEEVLLASTLGTDTVPASMEEALQRHGLYILKHVSFSADEHRLRGSASQASIITGQTERVKFQFEFRADAAGTQLASPKTIRVQQTMLSDVKASAGDTWEAAYVLNIGTQTGARVEGLLARDKTVSFNCQWHQNPANPLAPEAATAEKGPSTLFAIGFIAATFAALVLVARWLESRKKSQ